MSEDAKKITSLFQMTFHWKHQLFRYTGVFGKDLVQATRMIVVMGTFFWIILILNSLYDATMTQSSHSEYFPLSIIRFLFLTTCYVIGITLTGEEEDHQTHVFLMRLPLNPVWTQIKKCIVGLISIFLWILFFCLVPYLILHAIIPESKNLIEIFSFSEITILNGTALLLTGITMGIYSRGNIVLSSIVGFVSYGIFVTGGASIYTYLIGDQSLSFSAALVNANKLGVPFFHYLWISIMVGLGLYRTLNREEIDSPIEWKLLNKLSSKKETVQKDITPRLIFKQHARMLFLAAPILALILTVSLSLLAQGDVHVFDLIVLVLISAFNGVYLWGKEERDRCSFFIFALPLNEKSFINERLWLAGKLGVYCAIATFVGKIIGHQITEHSTKPDLVYWLAPLIISIPLSIGICSLGILIRLFCKQTLIALFFTLTQAFTWIVASMLSYSSIFTSDKSSFTWSLETLEAFIWIPLLMTVIPIALIHLLIRKSRLLELNEGSRTGAVILLTLNLGIWVPFLILISPLDIIRMLFL